MIFSTLDNIVDFKKSQNKIPLEEFSNNKSKKSIFINLSFLVDLKTLNKILICAPLFADIDFLSEDSYIKYSNYFNKKNITKYFFNKNFFLMKIFFNTLRNQTQSFNSLLELAYFKAFVFALDNSYKSKLYNLGDYISLHYIPKIEFEAICINKYSYFYNAYYDKSIKKEVNTYLKDNSFVDSLSASDRLFFNTISNKKIEVGYLDDPIKIKNDYILQRELYMIYQNYLILLSILSEDSRKQQEKIDVSNKFFNVNYFNETTDLSVLLKAITFYFDHLLFELYEFVYKYFNFSSISNLSALPSKEIHNSFNEIDLNFKKYLLSTILP